MTWYNPVSWFGGGGSSSDSAAQPSGHPSGCPVDHSKMAAAAAAGGCPIDHSKMVVSNTNASNNNAVVLDPNNRDLKKDLKRLMASDSGACPYAAGNEAKRAALEAKNAEVSGGVESPGDVDKQMSHGDGYSESPNERINPQNMMPDMANKPLVGDSEEIEIDRTIKYSDAGWGYISGKRGLH
jgi:hypothetical protein